MGISLGSPVIWVCVVSTARLAEGSGIEAAVNPVECGFGVDTGLIAVTSRRVSVMGRSKCLTSLDFREIHRLAGR